MSPLARMFLLTAFVTLSVGCGDKDDDSGGSSDSGASDGGDGGSSDSGDGGDGGNGGSDSCTCETGTLVADDGCAGWGDEEECSGWASVYCENNPADCPEHEYDLTSEFSSGTSFTAFGCTICLDCGDGSCAAKKDAAAPGPKPGLFPECLAGEAGSKAP